ncbi:Phytochrome-like protein cph1 [Sedimentisphaera cyanobacteriorum]|uniref:histidine kinase n=1 Tax=Sedimentisphaera cyanobacteriorum TaxID=1940790 RepID=A0A1Q2HSC4_9BACT|nr:ATP-binding protein [Sedimentisphaera cyanobacteriorum]AQQ10357.1 Phytochrome-like protein cph1 [Sedimentisphaera cyanobacteriorum]
MEKNNKNQKCSTEEDLQRLAYAVSHDMREPLRMIASYLQLIEMEIGDKFTEESRTYMDNALKGARDLNGFIDGLVEYSRVTTDGHKFELTDLNELIEDVKLDMRNEIKASGAEITYSQLPAILVDERQFLQLFRHIIDNSIKFQGESAPKIRIYAEAKKGTVEFTVSDNGIGMHPENAQKAAGFFTKLNPREDHPGCGMGLAVVKRIVQRHGGELKIQSLPGHGTNIIFTIRP